jgi:hypothetical protein
MVLHAPPRRPGERDGDQPATSNSEQEWTARQFGDGVSDDAEAARIENGRAAIAEMRANRGPNIRLNRIASDRLYPDRRQAAG